MPVRLPALPCLLLSVATATSHAATPAIAPAAAPAIAASSAAVPASSPAATAVAAAAATPAATAAAAPAANWNAIARQDMQFAIDTLRSSHAGVVGGKLDASAPLDSGAQAALIEAGQVQTERDYKRAMVRFIASFGDPHTSVQVKLKTEAWTGVVLDRIDGQYRVVWSEPGWPTALPPVNAIAQSCDGVWVGTYLKTSVAPFSTRSMEYALAASDHARDMMFDNGLGWAPQRCTFTLPGGGARSFDLPLRPVADVGAQRIADVQKKYAAVARPTGLYPLAKGMHVASMPNFDGAESGAAYEKMYGELAKLRGAQWIVFDLRGNGGGNSDWGNRALKALYGEQYGEQLGEMASYGKRLIAAPATVTLFRRFADAPENAASRQELLGVVQRLESARQQGAPMAVLEDATAADNLALGAKVRQRPGGPRLAAIIDRKCFSSCMSFLLQVQAIGDTVVLGEPTLGYSPYGEIAGFKLPSGKGALGIASALYDSRQATREPFVPDLAYPGNMADDAALTKWVAATLAKTRPGQKPHH